MPSAKARPARRPAGRSRLPAERARAEILEVAGRRLREVGPEGLRLQDIAREVGVSHPAILHHFGSREGLVRAVVDRSLGGLEQDVIETLRAATDPASVDPIELFHRIQELMAERGNARLIAWLVLAGYESPAAASRIREVADVVHQMRKRHFRGRGERPPGFEDTLFVVLLATVALFGDALSGEALRESAGLGRDPPAARRFRQWFAELLVERLDRQPPRRA